VLLIISRRLVYDATRLPAIAGLLDDQAGEGGSEDGGDGDSWLEVDEPSVVEGTVPGGRNVAAGGSAEGRKAVAAKRQMLPRGQPPLSSGSTPWEEGRGARFLAYTREGAIVARKVDNHQTMEVSRHAGTRLRTWRPAEGQLAVNQSL